ncbi:zinc knuckle [Ancylostoma caninum]|uniref:Zinc knuckle n=1 Tax=Ancylostoma caninum TaxID=29170 RepID=A0A368GJR1_ANCCA|nr:zinc knuckle [Ancylostoma caninum]
MLKQMSTRNNSEEDWDVQELLAELDKSIATEERVAEMLRDTEPYALRGDKAQRVERRFDRPQNRNAPAAHRKCLYCEGDDHNSLRCSKVRMIKDRIEFLKGNKLCMNCGKQDHFAQDCVSKGCARCDRKKHHFSICPKLLEVVSAHQKESTHQPQPAKGKEGNRTKFRKGTNIQCVESIPSSHSNEPEAVFSTATEYATEGLSSGKADVFLLTGKARIKHAKTGKLQEVQVLLDTGADKSFIESGLAEELELPILRTVDLAMYTFGAKEPKEKGNKWFSVRTTSTTWKNAR